METARNVVNLFDDGRQPREVSAEETDAQVYILTDPLDAFLPLVYRQEPGSMVDREQAAYFAQLNAILKPFASHPDAEMAGRWLLSFAAHLEEQGERYDRLLKTVEEAAADYWAIINGDTIESTDTI